MKKVMLFMTLTSLMSLAQEEVLEPAAATVAPTVEKANRVSDDGQSVITYKKEDYFDFGALEVKGEILSPSELGMQSNRRVKFQIKKHIRRDFDDYIREDLIDIH